MHIYSAAAQLQIYISGLLMSAISNDYEPDCCTAPANIRQKLKYGSARNSTDNSISVSEIESAKLPPVSLSSLWKGEGWCRTDDPQSKNNRQLSLATQWPLPGLGIHSIGTQFHSFDRFIHC